MLARKVYIIALTTKNYGISPQELMCLITGELNRVL